MSNCACQENPKSTSEHVPDFSVGFQEGSMTAMPEVNLEGVSALRLAACVAGSYDGHEICFTVPIYGSFCVRSPVRIPLHAQIKVCVETCGRLIPTGMKASVYINNDRRPVASFVLFGAC